MARGKQVEKIQEPLIVSSWIFVKNLNARYNGNQLSIWECANCHKNATYKFQKCSCGAKMSNSHVHEILIEQWENKKGKGKKK